MSSAFDIDVLIDAVAERVAAKLCAKMPHLNGGPAVGPRLLTIDAAAKYIGRTRAAVDHMVRAGRLPIVRADRKIFLDLRDLDKWIDENKVTPDGV